MTSRCCQGFAEDELISHKHPPGCGRVRTGVTSSHARDCAIFLNTNSFTMGSLLALAAGMRTFGLLLSLMAVAPQATTDQKLVVPEGTIITSAQVTGFDDDRLSPGLREEIRSLAGTPVKQERLDELAARIEAERPRYVAAVRAVLDSDGRARVYFVMGRQSEPDRDNVNARYIVEQADITGVPDDELTTALRDDLQALIGKRLDSGDADRLRERMERELPRYEISRRIQRGGEAGRIRLVYRGPQEGAATVAALRATPIERPLSLRAGLGKLPGPRHRRSQHPVHANRRPRQRGQSRRGTPATGCASKRGSLAPAGSAPASSGPGSSRIGSPPRWMHSRSIPRFQVSTTRDRRSRPW